MTGVTYDHEVKSSYTVVVKADDSNGGTAASVTVTITITDVTEAPGRPAAPNVTATSGSTTSLDVSWSAPTNTGPQHQHLRSALPKGQQNRGLDQRSRRTTPALPPPFGSLDAGTAYQRPGACHQRRGRQRLVALRERHDHGMPATPTVTISADKTSAVFKQDGITYTLTRSGSTTAALPVMVTLTQTKDFLAATALSQDGDDRRGPVDGDLHGRGLQLPTFRGGNHGRGRNADRGGRRTAPTTTWGRRPRSLWPSSSAR